MNLIRIFTFFCIIQFSSQSHANDKKVPFAKTYKMISQSAKSRCLDDPKNPQLKCSKRTPLKRSQQEIIAQKKKPHLKINEYTLRYEDNKTTVFGTKIHEGLLLSQNCFKSKKPRCLAYTKSIQTAISKPEDHMKSPFHNNLGAIHCELMGGKGLIAKTSTNDDSDFCQFEDGSMVSSWSAYYKTHQQAIQSK